MSEATRVIIIGWKGAEDHFQRLLREKLPQAVPIKVVSGRPESAAETIKVLTDVGINASFTWFDGGFTNFILKRGIDEFLGSS